jgi:hypothetical protein
MFEYLVKQLQYLPPLRGKKNPIWALAIGFLTGGVGLGIYFRSLIDSLVPILLTIGVGYYSDQALYLGWMLGPSVTAVYGYARVQDSNLRLTDARS